MKTGAQPAGQSVKYSDRSAPAHSRAYLPVPPQPCWRVGAGRLDVPYRGRRNRACAQALGGCFSGNFSQAMFLRQCFSGRVGAVAPPPARGGRPVAQAGDAIADVREGGMAHTAGRARAPSAKARNTRCFTLVSPGAWCYRALVLRCGGMVTHACAERAWWNWQTRQI